MIIPLISTVVFLGLFLLIGRKFMIVEIDFDELDKTSDTCPKCDEFLYLERDGFVDVYRCKHCRFEGAKMNTFERLINHVR